MDMKKFIAIFAILLVALPLALAEETTTDDPGITPDSALYGVDKALDSISLALTFDHAKRAEKSLKIAQERLLEVQKMLQEGKDEYAQEAQKEYEQNLDDSTDEADKVSSDGNKDKAAKALEKLAKLQNKREEHQAFVTDVHERMLERMKDNLTEDQYNKLQEIFSKIENKTRDSESLLESRREAVKTKYKALSGKNDTQVDEDFSNFEKALLEARKEREIQQREKAKERVLEVKEKLKNLNVTDFDDDLEIALELLNNTNSSVDLSDEFRMHGNEISAIANMLRQAKQNGTWNETKAKLMEAIRNRQTEHREYILNKLKEQRENVAERMAERLADMADRDRNLTNREEDRLENRLEKRIEERLRKDGAMRIKEKMKEKIRSENGETEIETENELEIENETEIEHESDDNSTGSGSDNSSNSAEDESNSSDDDSDDNSGRGSGNSNGN